MPLFQSNVFQHTVFQGPYSTPPSTFRVPAGGWTRDEWDALRRELRQERNQEEKKKKRREQLDPLVRVNEDMAALEKELITSGTNYNAVSDRIDELAVEREALLREKRIKDLAETIKAQRQAWTKSP